MKLQKTFFTLFFLILTINFASAQLIEKDYYLFPINPGKKAYISGTMGELRSNHFHAGLDIKTGGVEGLPVYAAADGYISRIKVSSYGYGNALYIQHPNGQTTVYAHLLSYREDIQKKVTEEHYKNERFEIEFFPEKDDFPIKKGDIIAKSGNTGGSGGPHLHWEIRDAYQRPVNPLLGGFSEVIDNIKPILYKVGFTTLSSNAHVNNEFGFFSLTPNTISSSEYKLNDITAYGEIGLSVNANDKLNGSSNKNGVAGIEVYMDGKLSFEYYNDRFSFASSRMINHHIEYGRYKDGFGRFHRCYVADGNTLDFYKKNESNGKIHIYDTLNHKVSVRIWDAYNNETTLKFNIKGQKINSHFPSTPVSTQKVRTRVQENILRVAVANNGKPLNYYLFGQAYSKEPLYIKDKESIYTFDLRKEIPDSIVKGNIHFTFNLSNMIVPKKEFTSYHGKAIVRFNSGILKDTLYLKYSEKDDVFDIGDAYTPLYKNVDIILRPSKTYPNKAKTAVYNDNGSYNAFIGGDWMGENIEFRTRNLGTFKILEDTTEPTAKLISKNTNTIKIKIGDDLSGIKSYRATLDGEFLLMAFRYQTNTLTSIRKDDSVPLKGLFKLEVTDMVDNVKVYTLQL